MAGTAGAIRAGQAYVELHGKDDKLQETLKTDEAAVSTWGQKITAIGNATGAAMAKGLQVIGKAALSTTTLATGAIAAFGSAARSFADNAMRLAMLPKTGFTGNDIKQARALQRAFDTVAVSIQVLWSQIGAAVAPVITQVLQSVAKVIQGMSKWVSEHRPLIATIFQLTVKVAAFAAGLFVAVKVMAIVGAAVALIANPVGILLTVLAAGVAAWLAWTSSGQRAAAAIRDSAGSVIGWLTDRFNAFYKDFQMVWDGIVAAISAGDLATAAEIAWTGMKLAFFESLRAIGVNWNKWYTTYVSTVALIGNAWDVLFTRLSQGWDFVFTRVKQGWRGTQTFLSKGMAILMGVLEGKTAEQRQQVLDDLDAERDRENKRDEAAMQQRNRSREQAMTDAIAERAAKLAEELSALPASDQKRIDELRAKLTSLSNIAKDNAPDQPQFYSQKSFATAGTFNAAAIRGVAGGGPLDQIAKHTKDTAANTKRLANEPKSGRVEYEGW